MLLSCGRYFTDVLCRTIVISGPNMGGKSSYVRMVALLALMSHVGWYALAR